MSSPDLQWMILRNYSCFLLKNQGTTFTKEPLNLTGRHAFKYSGLVNKKAIGITADPTGKGVVLTTKKTKYANKPSKVNSKMTLASDSRRTVQTVKNLCGKNFYRRDLQDAAARRASAILRSQRATTGVQKKRTRRKRN
ncbi:60S ribosomal protein L28 [Desmophyllum pertusum]|uniref:Large ribosomal subunit protein eL28 n=1 Tax=Desmophyllum pertusum TaxID=174260 RepID=A0A9W9ZL14_9CNID|nr:60S ribosomal protein L28 [Desmophyllum pertusum]